MSTCDVDGRTYGRDVVGETGAHVGRGSTWRGFLSTCKGLPLDGPAEGDGDGPDRGAQSRTRDQGAREGFKKTREGVQSIGGGDPEGPARAGRRIREALRAPPRPRGDCVRRAARNRYVPAPPATPRPPSAGPPPRRAPRAPPPRSSPPDLTDARTACAPR